ncbi:MAG TPA: hypothetical protein VIV54_17320 [Burkholderiales bacterium]
MAKSERSAWWENAIPLGILAAGLMVRAPLEQRTYALLGVGICAIAARIALVMGRRTSAELFSNNAKKKSN